MRKVESIIQIFFYLTYYLTKILFIICIIYYSQFRHYLLFALFFSFHIVTFTYKKRSPIWKFKK